MQQEALLAMPNVVTPQLQCFHTFKTAMKITDKKQEVGEESGSRRKKPTDQDRNFKDPQIKNRTKIRINFVINHAFSAVHAIYFCQLYRMKTLCSKTSFYNFGSKQNALNYY